MSTPPKPKIKTVIIEYDPSAQVLYVRGVYDGRHDGLPLFHDQNLQNQVQCFEDIEMKIRAFSEL